MPGVKETLPTLRLPLALWANTRNTGERDLRVRLRKAGLEQFFSWVELRDLPALVRRIQNSEQADM